MSSGGQSNASQTPFAPNYGQAQGISGLGAGLTGGGFGSNMGGGNAYAQKFKQPSMGMFPPTSPQPQQGQPQPPPGLTVNTPGTQNGVSGYYSDSSMSNFFPNTPAGEPQPPPGMMLNPEYGGDLPSGTFRSLGPDSIKYVPDPNQPQPQTGGDIQYRDTKFRPGGGGIQDAQHRPAGSFLGGPYDPAGGYFGGGFGGGYGQGYGNPFGGGFGGGYDQGYGNPFGGFGGGFGGGYDQGYGNPFGGFGGGYGGGYGNPFGGYGGGYGGFNPMMGMGLGGMLGGYQGGFNPQSQAQAQMRAYQQNQPLRDGRGGFEGGDIGNTAFNRRRMEALIDRPQPQRKPNQPAPGMVKNPHYQARGGGTQTMDMKFSDNEYVTPEALKNFDTEQTSQSAEYQRAISDPNMEIKEIAGQKYKYSPSTGRYMID